MIFNDNDHILILKGFRIGDAICQTPAIHLLRQTFPNATITIVTLSSGTAQIFQNNPHLNQVISNPSKKELKTLNKEYNYALAFDQKTIVYPYLKYLNIPVYFCFDQNSKTHLRQIVIDKIIQLYQLKNQPIIYDYELFPSKQNEKMARELLIKKGATLNGNEILIGIHMGCFKVAERLGKWFKRNVSSRRTWPFERYQALTQKLYQYNPNIRFIFTGTKNEKKLIQKLFKNDKKIVNVAGETSVLELAAMMKYFKLLLTGDTGPMHIAITMKIPLLALFSPTRPENTGPYPIEPYHSIIYKKNTTDITLQEVYDKILQQLND